MPERLTVLIVSSGGVRPASVARQSSRGKLAAVAPTYHSSRRTETNDA